MILAYIKIILAVCLFWPRGYLLAYIIDRSKSFSFGFKFFAGWAFGLAAFTLDVFVSNVFGGFKLTPWIFLVSGLGQIIGLEIVIFILEKKIILPNAKELKKLLAYNFKKLAVWSLGEKLALIILVLTIVVRIGASIWQVTNIPTYDFDAWNNWNLRAKVIYTEGTIPLEKDDHFYLGGGIKSYPLNDGLFKVWLATAASSFADRYINLASIFYYLLLLAVFYFSLPLQVNRYLKLLGTYFLSSLPILYFHSHVAYADLLFSVFLFLTVACIFYFLAGAGNSFFYFSGIALAFSIWTKNEGLSVVFPVIFLVTIILWLGARCKFKQILLYWFWPVVTILPWLSFRIMNRLDILSGDSSTFKLVFNYQFIVDIFSSVFLRSHFNFLWLLVFFVIIFKFKDIWKSLSLRFLSLILIILFLIYNSIILFTDKAYDLGALARVNMQLAPLAVLLVVFFFYKFFAKINSYGKYGKK